MQPLLDTIIFGNSIARWLLALLIAGAVMGGVSVWRRVTTHPTRPLAIRTNTFFDDVAVVLAENMAGPIVLLLAIYAGSLILSLPPEARLPMRSGAIILLLLQIGIWGNALLGRWVARYDERNRETNAAGVGTARLISVVARIALYSVVLLLILDNLPGIEITALVASLGIGGIAVALAVQNILSDLFASLSIALDKPFVLGDLIGVGDDVGTVEQIGLKTTRVRSLAGEQLIFSNNDLLGSRVRNFARQERRRVVFSFRVNYSTPPERLRELPALVQALVEAHEGVGFDRAHLLRFDDVGLFYEVVYTVEPADFNRYADIQQAINLAMVERFAATGIGFASLSYPVRFRNIQIRELA
ncbi:MAG: mechanosensitive ion channel family protein [Chloroflexales bacterium]|nr:mechanosensitive ion channel family protein [Chloroflexales bacterium]